MNNNHVVQTNICGLCKTSTTDTSLVQVCGCRSGRVHIECMLIWVGHQEIMRPGLAAICPDCRRPYSVLPDPDNMLATLQHIARDYSLIIKNNILDTICMVVWANITFSAIGMLALSFASGADEVEQLIRSVGLAEAILVCQTIPYVSILINCIRWEDAILNCLRRCSRLPVLELALPKENPSVVPKKIYPRLNPSAMYEGLLLPFYATLTGKLLFGFVQSDLHRFALGGVFFFTLKSIINMYRKQKMYARRRYLRVVNHEENQADLL